MLFFVLFKTATKFHKLSQRIYYCDIKVPNLLITCKVHIFPL